MKAFLGILILGLGIIVQYGCLPTADSHSPIIKKAEAAGSGDLRLATRESMVQWLGQHDQMAIEINQMCVPVRAKATADWPQTTEGRLCAAAAERAASRFTPVYSDRRAWSATK